jgi:hypothetical protein
MDTPTIRKKVKELGSNLETVKSPVFLSGSDYLKSPYTIIPIAVIIFLLLGRPSFLYTESNNERKFCIKKVLGYWFFFSFVLVIGVYGYNYKKT